MNEATRRCIADLGSIPGASTGRRAARATRELNLNDTYRHKNGKRLEGDALAQHMAQNIRGKQLIMVYMKVKHAGLKVRVHNVDGTAASSSTERDASRINVELTGDVISNAWVG